MNGGIVYCKQWMVQRRLGRSERKRGQVVVGVVLVATTAMRRVVLIVVAIEAVAVEVKEIIHQYLIS